MRNYFYLIVTIILFSSCTKDYNISEELVGVWIYEREAFRDGVTNFDFDNSGFIEFKVDKTGFWDLSEIAGENEFLLKWQLNSEEDKLVLSKRFDSVFTPMYRNRVYILKRMDEDNFTLTYTDEDFNDVDVGLVVVEFENIILTRIS